MTLLKNIAYTPACNLAMACKPVSSDIQEENYAVCKSFIFCQEQLKPYRSQIEPVDLKTVGRDETSKQLRKDFVKLVTIWECYVHDVLKETVEIVFDHASSPNVMQDLHVREHLENVLGKALLHHSSHDASDNLHNCGEAKHEGSDLKNKSREQETGAAEMSAHLLPHPHLWKSHFDSYKQSLLTKCDQVIPVFCGKDGIDCTLNSILDVHKALSIVILEKGPVKHWYRSYGDNFGLELATSEGLNDMLRLYHSIYCIFADRHPEMFAQLDGELFDSPTKENFQKSFGEIPGDYLHLLYDYVRQYRETAWIYHSTVINLMRFIRALACYVRIAISRIVRDKYGIRIWHKTCDYDPPK